jgi:hypothetical protein
MSSIVADIYMSVREGEKKGAIVFSKETKMGQLTLSMGSASV